MKIKTQPPLLIVKPASNLIFKGAKLPFSKQNSQKVNLCSTFPTFHTGLHSFNRENVLHLFVQTICIKESLQIFKAFHHI